MLIRALIERFFAAGAEIHDLDRRVLAPQEAHSEFLAIRGHLLANFAPGARIALGLQRDHRYFLSILACMDAGMVFVPLRLDWPAARIEQIRQIVDFAVLLTDELVEAVISRGSGRGADAAPPPVAPDQPLYCLFTSGTTGAPKGVVIRRSSYENFLEWCDTFFADIGPQDRLLNSTDYTFDVAMAEVALALARRAAFVCSRFRDDLFTLLEETHELRINVLASVPNNFAMLLDERWRGRADLSGLRHALVAGSRFPVSLDAQFKRMVPAARVYNCYGPTEATIYCIARRIGDERDYIEQDTVSVGTPLPGCLATIVDEQLRPVARGERGELLIGGVQVMEGYVNDPATTDRVFVQVSGTRYYRTGDLAFRNARGDYFITGRNDDTIKVAGQRVNLSDIDGYVQRLDFVRACAAIAVEDPRRGAAIVLYLVASRPLDREEAFSALKEVLPRHQLPQDIRFVEQLPVNNSGKIDKKALKRSYIEERGGSPA